jgi:hypothetical protein
MENNLTPRGNSWWWLWTWKLIGVNAVTQYFEYAVYCENHTEHTDTVRTSLETNYISDTEDNRLMLFRETVAVYWEREREKVWGSSERHYNSGGIGNKIFCLMVPRHCPLVLLIRVRLQFRIWEPYGTHKSSSYFTGNTLRLRYRD